MGSKHSMIDKPLGKSIYNKIYQTKVPVYIGMVDEKYCHNAPCLYIREYINNDKCTFRLNPKIGEFWIKLNPGVKFVVTNVNLYWGIDAGTSISILIDIINEIKNTNNDVMEGIFHSKTDTLINAQWIDTKISHTVNEEIMNLMSCDKSTFNFNKKKIILDPQYFGKNDYWHIKEDIPFEFKEDLIEYIDKNKNKTHIIDEDNEINFKWRVILFVSLIILLCCFVTAFSSSDIFIYSTDLRYLF